MATGPAWPSCLWSRTGRMHTRGGCPAPSSSLGPWREGAGPAPPQHLMRLLKAPTSQQHHSCRQPGQVLGSTLFPLQVLPFLGSVPQPQAQAGSRPPHPALGQGAWPGRDNAYPLWEQLPTVPGQESHICILCVRVHLPEGEPGLGGDQRACCCTTSPGSACHPRQHKAQSRDSSRQPASAQPLPFPHTTGPARARSTVAAPWLGDHQSCPMARLPVWKPAAQWPCMPCPALPATAVSPLLRVPATVEDACWRSPAGDVMVRAADCFCTSRSAEAEHEVAL